MKTVKISHAEALKAELMERYGLREDQVRLELIVCTTDLETGRQILADFDREYEEDYLPEDVPCDNVYGKEVASVWVHRKDGFYGSYVVGDDTDE